MKGKILIFDDTHYILIWQRNDESERHYKELSEEQYWLPLFNKVHANCISTDTDEGAYLYYRLLSKIRADKRKRGVNN